MALSTLEKLQKEINELPLETRERLYSLLEKIEIEENQNGLQSLEKIKEEYEENQMFSLLGGHQNQPETKDSYYSDDLHQYKTGKKTLLESFNSFRNRGKRSSFKLFGRAFFSFELILLSGFFTSIQFLATISIFKIFDVLSLGHYWFAVIPIIFTLNLIVIYCFFEDSIFNGNKNKNSISEFLPTGIIMEKYSWNNGKTLLKDTCLYLPHMPIVKNKENVAHLTSVWNMGDSRTRDLLIKKLELNEPLTMDDILFINLYLENKDD